MNNEWTLTRVDVAHVEAINDPKSIKVLFIKNPDGSWDGRCQNPDEILASYRRLGMKPDAKALAAIMQEAGRALNDFLRVERRGGARPGAGRPPKNGVSRAEYKPILITKEAWEHLQGIENRCRYVSELIIKERRH